MTGHVERNREGRDSGRHLFPSPGVGGEGAARGGRVVGHGRRQQEIEAVEHVAAPEIQLAALASGGAERLGRHVPGAFQSLRERVRHVLALLAKRLVDLARDQEVAERSPGRGEHWRAARHMVLEQFEIEAGLVERGRGVAGDCGHVALDSCVAQVGRPGDPDGRRQSGVERLPVAEAGVGQGGGIAGRGACHQVQEQGGVGHGPGQGAVDRGAAVVPGLHRPAGYPPLAGLESEGAGEAGGNADRAAAVGGGDQGQHAAGQRRGRTAARSTGGALQVPGRPGHAEQRVLGDRGEAELRRIRLADDDRPGGPQPGHLGRIGFGHRVAEHARTHGGHHAGNILEVLDAQGHAFEGAGISGGAARVGRFGVGDQRLARPLADDGVELGIRRFDAVEGGGHQLDAGGFSGRQNIEELDQAQTVELHADSPCTDLVLGGRLSAMGRRWVGAVWQAHATEPRSAVAQAARGLVAGRHAGSASRNSTQRWISVSRQFASNRPATFRASRAKRTPR